MAEDGLDFDEMNLGNVADGELEQQFVEELQKVMDVKANLHAYQNTKGAVKCSIVMDCEFTFDAETGAVLVGTSADFKAPKRRKVRRSAFIRDGRVLVEHALQTSFLDGPTNIAKLREAAQGGTENGE